MEFPDLSKFIGVFMAIIGWTGFIIALSMFRNFISHGVSIALAEWLLKSNDREWTQRIVRWLANGDEVLARLDEIRDKTEGKKK